MLTPPVSKKRVKIILASLGCLLVVFGGFYLLTGYSPRQSLKTIYSFVLHEFNRSKSHFLSFNFFALPQVLPPENIRVSPIDNMTQVFVPAGNFLMGENDGKASVNSPQRSVYMDAFWIDRTEVTNQMYALCVQSQKCGKPVEVGDYYSNPRYANYPVVYVVWEFARDYCVWAGRELPTEAQWEKAARGTDGRTYPWGNTEPDASLLNYDDNIGGPLPVDRYITGASPYGALNMAGNVREWVNDWYIEDYYTRLPDKNPTGAQTGTVKSLRGGSFTDSSRQARVFNRLSHKPVSSGWNRGFRCASQK